MGTSVRRGKFRMAPGQALIQRARRLDSFVIVLVIFAFAERAAGAASDRTFACQVNALAVHVRWHDFAAEQASLSVDRHAHVLDFERLAAAAARSGTATPTAATARAAAACAAVGIVRTAAGAADGIDLAGQA